MLLDIPMFAAIAALPASSFTDDCQYFERLGFPVRLVSGDTDNIKITRPSDLAVAEQLLRGETEC